MPLFKKKILKSQKKKKEQKQVSTICCLETIDFTFKDTHRPQVKGQKNILHASENQKKTKAAILTSDKIDCYRL